MSVSIGPVVDRIHMTIGVGGGDLYSFLISQMYGLLDSSLNLLPGGKITLKKDEFSKRLNFWSEKKRKTADITVGVTKSKHKYFKLGLYPSKIQEGDLDKIKFILSTLFPDWSYEELFASANVSYIEIAHDFLNKDTAFYLPYHPAFRNSKFHKNSDGSNGSAYLGSEQSSKRYCVYDKAKKLLETQSKSNLKIRMRVEVRLRKTGLKPINLVDGLENPFQGLELLDIQKLMDLSEEAAWVDFVQACCCVGTACALKQCNKKLRKIYKSRLQSAKVGWWNANQWWGKWPSAVAAIQP